MKNKYLIFTLLLFTAFVSRVSAGGSISTNTSSVYSGDSFTITASINGSATWNVNVGSSGPVSGCTIRQAGYTDDLSETSKTWSATCNTNGTGTVTITLSGTITNGDGVTTPISGSRTVQVVDRPSNSGSSSSSSNSNNSSNNNSSNNTVTKKDTKSSNNNLKELSITDYKISPEFDKSKTEYTLTVPNEVNKITINATKEHDKASISGDGEKELKEGENKFEIVVTAENGSKKTYKITVIVDSKPIIVKIDKKEYTIVKNKEDLPELEIEHEDMTLTIEEQEIPAFRIDKINYVLVGLKDSEGNINLYKFDSFKNDEKEPEYRLFKYLKSSGILFVRLDFPKNKIPKNYKKYTETINEEKVEVYKLSKNSKYSLIYGLNLETNKENIYRYDKEENTLQIFEREEAEKLEEKVVRREKLIMILGGVIFVLIILTTIGFTRRPKMKDEDFFDEKEIKNEKEEIDKLTKKDIQKIEKENKKLEKQNKKKLKKGDFDM